MIHYQLRCSQTHEFDGWFRDSTAFTHQVEAGLLECPSCGNTTVTRALMAPALGRKNNKAQPAAAPSPDQRPDQRQDPAPVATPVPPPPPAAGAALPDELRAALQKLRAEVETRCEHVGPRFAEEARAIHNGETEARPIYGEATPDQAEALAEDGIDITRIPWLPRADS